MKNNEIDEFLLASELLLTTLPRKKFQLDSWQVFDKFMAYAVDVFSMTFVNLLKGNYLIYTKEEKPTDKMFVGKKSKEINFKFQLIKKPKEQFLIGWVENKILCYIESHKKISLSDIVYSVLNDILGKNSNFNNPGKALIFQIIKNQKLNLFEYKMEIKYLGNYIIINPKQAKETKIKAIELDVDDINLSKTELQIIKRIIKEQLKKFQNLD